MTTDELIELLEHVQRVQKLADAATKGPWKHFQQDFNAGWHSVGIKSGKKWIVAVAGNAACGSKLLQADEDFITDSRTSVPLLCAGIVAMVRDRLSDMEVESCSTSFYDSNSLSERNSFLSEISKLKAALVALEEATDANDQS